MVSVHICNICRKIPYIFQYYPIFRFRDIEKKGERLFFSCCVSKLNLCISGFKWGCQHQQILRRPYVVRVGQTGCDAELSNVRKTVHRFANINGPNYCNIILTCEEWNLFLLYWVAMNGVDASFLAKKKHYINFTFYPDWTRSGNLKVDHNHMTFINNLSSPDNIHM